MVTLKKTDFIYTKFIITIIRLGESKTVGCTGYNGETWTEKSSTKSILLSNCAFMH